MRRERPAEVFHLMRGDRGRAAVNAVACAVELQEADEDKDFL